MNRERIQLTRIIALNWYGFRTIVDVRGLTLLCGETGTGKSALLDLIQFVMCPTSSKFNKAAAGESNARDLRGYCLCDTNTRNRESGQSRFIRRSGATIAALEFEWPKLALDPEPRRETWGIRVQYESPTAQPTFVRFFVPSRMDRDDLIDANGELLTEDAFRVRVKRDLDGDPGFGTHKHFIEEMAVPRHLHFDAMQMRKTLPKAIAFELDSDYQRFIREFILERDDLDISKTKSSLDALRETERRVLQLANQFEILSQIEEAHSNYVKARKEHALFGHLRHALNHAEASENYARCQQSLSALGLAHQENIVAMERAVNAKNDAEKLYDTILLSNGIEDRELANLHALHGQRDRLIASLQALTEKAKAIRDSVYGRAQKWESWLGQAKQMQWEIMCDLEPIAALRGAQITTSIDAITRSCGVFQSIWSDARPRVRVIEDALEQLSNRKMLLERKLARIAQGASGGTPLLDALRSLGVEADSLCRLVEVSEKGEPWWGVIETLLGDERNAVVLKSQTDFKNALELWRRMPDAEPLINPGEEVLASPQEKISLATLLETENSQVRQFLNVRLGKFAAAKDAEELEQFPIGAATPDGLLSDPPARRRVCLATEFTLGEKGLRRLELLVRSELDTVVDELKVRQLRRDDVHAWLNRGKQLGLDKDDLSHNYGELFRIPDVEEELSQVKAALAIASKPDLEERHRELSKLESEITLQNQRIGGLRGPMTEFSITEARLKHDLANALCELQSEVINLEASRTALPQGIASIEVQDIVSKALDASGSWRSKRDAAQNSQDQWQRQVGSHHEERARARGRLTQPEHESEYSDFDPTDDGNERYSTRLRELNDHELPRFRTLAEARRGEWEKRLHEDVLDNLRTRLEAATRMVSDFRRVLGRDIGNYRYSLSQRRDPMRQAMWRLINDDYNEEAPEGTLTDYKLREEIDAARRELMEAIDNPDNQQAAALLDYRTYHRYDLDMIPSGHGEESEGLISLQENVKKFSGGEGQAPFFVTMLAAFHRVYDVSHRGSLSNLGIVVMDEAFSKLSAGHIADSLALAKNFGLQLVLAFPMDRLGTMIHHSDSIIQCRMEKRYDAKGVPIDIINDVVYWERQTLIDELLS